MDEARIYEILESLQDKYLEGSLRLPYDSDIELGKQKFSQQVWTEPHEAGELVVFMLESQKIVLSKAFCLGLIIGKNGTTENLSNEQLWEIGIP